MEWEEEKTHSVVHGRDIVSKNASCVVKDEVVEMKVRTGSCGKVETYRARVIAIGKTKNMMEVYLPECI